ncbi:MAG TPA: cytochrome P460 family protein [Steroidobacteraceae bacterium]|nr:cytochrome P460 family protein [Steroidobacteraceae bacterium]
MSRRFPVALCVSLLVLSLSDAARPAYSGAPADASTPFTSDGQLKAPADYREWIFLTSGLDMSYRKTSGADHSMFDNVFVNPQAYQAFVRTGTWPEGTEFAKEGRAASERGSINKSGKFQSGDTMGVEVHIKDSKRFADGWGFFFFDSVRSGPTQAIPAAAPCYTCHRQNGAVDSTFVQFYPTLLSIATQKHTLSPTYRP